MTLPSFVDIRTMSSSWSLPVAGRDGHQVAGGGGLDRDDHGVRRLAALRREVAAVVGRALLVAERLEPILQVLLELLVELLGLQPERFFVGALAAADDRLAQREQELPQPFLAPARFDELERRVTEVVGQAAVRRTPRPGNRSSTGRCRRSPRRARSSGRTAASSRSCSRTGPHRPTAGGRGGAAIAGMMSNSKMCVSSCVISR